MRLHRTAASLTMMASTILAGCGQEPEGNACPATGARVYVTSAGVVSLNGNQLEVAALHDALSALSPAPTVVCYTRDDPAVEPSPAAMQAVDAIEME